jgi:hypothetical protein
MKGYIWSDGLAGVGVHCAGLMEDGGVGLLVAGMKVRSCESHTNHISMFENVAERESNVLKCET